MVSRIQISQINCQLIYFSKQPHNLILQVELLNRDLFDSSQLILLIFENGLIDLPSVDFLLRASSLLLIHRSLSSEVCHKHTFDSSSSFRKYICRFS